MDFRSTVASGTLALDNLSGIDFENLIGSLLAGMGFQIEMTKASGDGGVDIIATIERPLLKGRYLIQCKNLRLEALLAHRLSGNSMEHCVQTIEP